MLKRLVQQGRSERRSGGVPCGVRWGPERCENAAGGPFQHSAAGQRL